MARRQQSSSRTSEGMRDTLFDEIEELKNGNSTPQRARAMAALSGQILQSVRLEMEAQRLHTEYGDDVRLPGEASLRLGKG